MAVQVAPDEGAGSRQTERRWGQLGHAGAGLRAGRGWERVAFRVVCAFSVLFSGWFVWRSSFRVGDWLAFALFDDAMISMRYADNLAAGEGLVWNPGGERVEGITNPLWTGWMAVLHVLPVHPMKMSLLVMASGAAAVVAALWVARGLARELAPGDGGVAAAAVVVTATFFPLVYWSVSGMEVGVLAWLVGLVALGAVRLDRVSAGGRWRALAMVAVAGVAAVGVRLDAVVPVALAVAYCGWRAPGGRRAWIVAAAGGPAVVALVVMTGLRVVYYGDWLPNTYYLKATGTGVGERLGTGVYVLNHALLAQLGVVVLAGLWALAGRGPAGRGPAGRWLLAGLVAGQVCYSVWVGGDAWELLLFANRYVTVAVVPLAVLAAVGVRRIAADARSCGVFGVLVGVLAVVRWARFEQVPGATRWAAGAAVLVVGLVAGAAGALVLARHRHGQRQEQGRRGEPGGTQDVRDGHVEAGPVGVGGREVGRGPAGRAGVAVAVLTVLVVVFGNLHAVVNWWREPAVSEQRLAREGWAIAQATDQDATVAVWLAGAEVYFADRPAVDLYGKSDRHVARLAPVTDEFRPGHTKHDLGWSLRTYRPDLVQMPPGYLDDTTRAVLRTRGYEAVAGTLWVRSDTTKVDRDALGWAILRAST